MSALSVTPAELHASAENLRSLSKKIADELATLESKINQMRNEWSGESQAAYTNAQVQWHKQLLELQSILTSVATKTDEIATGYTSTDRAAASMFH